MAGSGLGLGQLARAIRMARAVRLLGRRMAQQDHETERKNIYIYCDCDTYIYIYI